MKIQDYLYVTVSGTSHRIIKFLLKLIFELRNETRKGIKGIVWLLWINIKWIENFQEKVARQESRAISIWDTRRLDHFFFFNRTVLSITEQNDLAFLSSSSTSNAAAIQSNQTTSTWGSFPQGWEPLELLLHCYISSAWQSIWHMLDTQDIFDYCLKVRKVEGRTEGREERKEGEKTDYLYII